MASAVAGYSPVMEEMQQRNHLDHLWSTDTGTLRRIITAAGLVIAALILIAVAIYAGAFIMLAPMMQ
ncbi:MAG TPA: hypothetical protein VHI10_05035 [Mycobacterium sp.]|nr:hypothetical protein [Mycobacterium sp.]